MKGLKPIAMAILVAITCIPTSFASDLVEIDGWKIAQSENAVVYTTNGQFVHGHEFGFAKIHKHCDQDLMVIKLSSRDAKVTSFKGSRPSFGLVFDKSEDSVKMPIEYSTYLAWTKSLYVMMFTNTEVTNSFVALVEKNPRVLVKLEQPPELSSLIDVEIEAFPLEGFAQARRKARELCQKGAI